MAPTDSLDSIIDLIDRFLVFEQIQIILMNLDFVCT